MGEALALLEGVEMGSLWSILLLRDSTEVSVSFKHLQQNTPGFVLIALSCRKCLLNTCCYTDMSGPLLHPFKAQNPAGVRICECFLLEAAKGGLEQCVTPEGTSPAGGVPCTSVCRECSAVQKPRKVIDLPD